MKKKVGALAALAGCALLGPTVASAQVLVNGGFLDGHYYEVYAAPQVSWTTASTAAQAKTYEYQPGKTVAGHLATLTSQAEDELVESLRAGSANARELWVGGLQNPCSTGPGCGWTWVNGEGAIAGANGGLTYANWLDGEPNDSAGRDEQHLAIGLGGRFGWNDEGFLGNIGGYVIEYDVPRSATGCGSPGGCETTSGQTLQFPSAPPAGATIGVNSYTFMDDPARCGNAPLSLFDGALVIPSYLCGSPSFLVVKTEPSFGIPSGTVQIENESELIFPNNTSNECASPISGDPANQAVVVWQATSSAEMHEMSNPTTSDYLPGIGYAGEYTNGCGSSRGSVRGGSYHVIGMHIGFASNDPAYVFAGYTALTTYKLDLLQVAVEKAKTGGALNKHDYAFLRLKADFAAKAFAKGKYQQALQWLKLFELKLKKANVTPKPFNHQGDLKMRSSNLIFMIKAKVIPLSK